MIRMAWMTDTHLNFLSPAATKAFFESLVRPESENEVENDRFIYLMGGDITDAPNLLDTLELAEKILKKPIYFVTGNHDYYHSSIEMVRSQLKALHESSSVLNWLPLTGVVRLTGKAALIGHGGWGDARYGDVKNMVMLNDDVLIREQAFLHPVVLVEKLNGFGDEAAVIVRKLLEDALKSYEQIYFLTHVPPFQESCWHEGKISDAHFLPRFTCKAVGDVLKELMAKHPNKQLTVLCGHSHGDGSVQILPNLKSITGGAEYELPKIQQIFEFAG